jgi:hypothetical protein
MLKELNIENLVSHQNSVATTLIPPRQSIVSSGFAKQASTVGGQRGLIELKVLIGNKNVAKDSLIYVSTDSYNSPWATTVFLVGELNFIMVPESVVIFVKTPVPELEPTKDLIERLQYDSTNSTLNCSDLSYNVSEFYRKTGGSDADKSS